MIGIREALDLVYRDLIKKQTVFSWLQRQTFRPEIYFPPPNGPGRQSLLSRADIVVMGILSCLFSLNIRFQQLQIMPGVTTDDTQIFFERAEVTKEGQPPMFHATIDSIGVGRGIQKFLEANDFQVICVVYRYRLPGSMADFFGAGQNKSNATLTRIFFFPPSLSHRYDRPVDELEPAETVSFVNIRRIVSHVDRALGM